MKIALMQPYFCPYIGYYQLIKAVDEFIIYDDVQYMKGGWINRNRILLNGKPQLFTLPVKRGSLGERICEKRLYFRGVENTKQRIMGQLHSAYKTAPYYQPVSHLIEEILSFKTMNLSDFIFNSLQIVCRHFRIDTPLTLSSSLIKSDEGLSGQERVLAICQVKKATHYINAIGGQELYSRTVFADKGIELHFLKTRVIPYQQFGGQFFPYLSIIDVLMFNSAEEIIELLSEYDLE